MISTSAIRTASEQITPRPRPLTGRIRLCPIDRFAVGPRRATSGGPVVASRSGRRSPRSGVKGQLAQRGRDLADRQHPLGRAHQDRLSRHAEHHRTGLILASVIPPARRMASSPSAPSRPIPVKRQPIAAAPSSRATDSNRTSTDGRQEYRSGPTVSRSRPSRSTMWRSAGAISTLALPTAGNGSPSVGRDTRSGERPSSQSHSEPPNGSPMWMTSRIGSGKSAGSRSACPGPRPVLP